MDHVNQYVYIQVHTGLTDDDGFKTMHPQVFVIQNSHSHCIAHGAARCMYLSPRGARQNVEVGAMWQGIIRKLLMAYNIQGVPGGMCQTSGGCSLC